METVDPEHWLERYGDELYRFALKRLRSEHDAEDVVQETLITAWRNRTSFRGEQSERNWLYTILKSRIIDCIRKRQTRQRSISEVDADGVALDEMFDARGHWRPSVVAWPEDASAQIERDEFQRIFAKCLDGLPPKQQQAFVLKEVEDEDAAAICQELNISTSNLWVMLHRARLRLRVCLEHHWFGVER
jgi:RNA polymerase sigma-70 factor (ECF subfamily)